MQVIVSPRVQVEITAHNGTCYAATGKTEQEARINLARRLHALADQALNDSREYSRLANSLDA